MWKSSALSRRNPRRHVNLFAFWPPREDTTTQTQPHATTAGNTTDFSFASLCPVKSVWGRCWANWVEYQINIGSTFLTGQWKNGEGFIGGMKFLGSCQARTRTCLVKVSVLHSGQKYDFISNLIFMLFSYDMIYQLIYYNMIIKNIVELKIIGFIL